MPIYPFSQLNYPFPHLVCHPRFFLFRDIELLFPESGGKIVEETPWEKLWQPQMRKKLTKALGIARLGALSVLVQANSISSSNLLLFDIHPFRDFFEIPPIKSSFLVDLLRKIFKIYFHNYANVHGIETSLIL